jgi:hypothetical protein
MVVYFFFYLLFTYSIYLYTMTYIKICIMYYTKNTLEAYKCCFNYLIPLTT